MLNVTSNIKQVLGFTERLSKQYPFAVALALTNTAKAVRLAMPAEVERDLDNPIPFTKQGFFYTPARKDNLTSVVGVKDKQAEYMQYAIKGGVRAPRNKALRLPAVVQVNAYGNLPAGIIKQLVTRAKQNKRATKTQARRFGVSQALDLFYGDPADGRPAGIYKRVNAGSKPSLVPIILFPQTVARYERRFDFEGAARRVALREFGPALDAAWARALASAR